MKPAKYLMALLSATFITACGGNDDPPTSTPGTASGATNTIAAVAEIGGFNALLAAATKAELGPLLADADADLTVFAPTDAAFGDLAMRLGFSDPTAMVEALPATALRDILTYHVLPSSKPAAELSAMAQSSQQTSYSFEGAPAALALDASNNGVAITDAALTTASVTSADVAASNGVVHAIDKVLVPPGVLNIVQMAQVNPAFSSLVSAVVSTDLQGALSGTGPFTVFAPTNQAFAAAPAGLTTEQLRTVLTYHVLDSQVLAADIPFGTPISTLANQTFVINEATVPTITDTTAAPANINATNVRASNGVIHVIDKVLIPAL